MKKLTVMIATVFCLMFIGSVSLAFAQIGAGGTQGGNHNGPGTPIGGIVAAVPLAGAMLSRN